ncbi:MAG: PAS domain S-box protein [Nitrospina sp.]|jgi:PAS domain S-box-containing protein|nr:PAS domain S-box protein [Nitrospina sp.]
MKQSPPVILHEKIFEAIESSCLVQDLDELLEICLSFLLQIQRIKKIEVSLFDDANNLFSIANAANKQDYGKEKQEIIVQSHLLNVYVKHSVRPTMRPRLQPVFCFPLLQNDGLLGLMNIQFEQAFVQEINLLKSLSLFSHFLSGKIREIMRAKEIRETKKELHAVRELNTETMHQVTALSKELYAITAISTKINQSLRLRKTLQRGTSKIMEVFDASSVMIFTKKLREKTFRLTYSDMRYGPLTKELKHDIEAGFLKDVTNSNKPIAKHRIIKPFNAKKGELESHTSFSIMGIPVRSKGKVLGAFLLFHKSSISFTPDNKRLLSGMVNIMAMAIENIEFFQHAEQKKKEAAFLVKSISSFSEKLDLKSTLKAVAEKGADLISKPCRIYLLTETRFPMIVTEASRKRIFPPTTKILDSMQPKEMKIFYHAMKNKKRSVLIRNVIRSKQMGNLGAYFESEGIHSLIMVPLKFRGKILGLLVLGRPEEKAPLDRHDLALSEALGGAASVAIQNSWAYADSLEIGDLLEKKIEEKTVQLQMIHDKQASRFENRNDITFWVNTRNQFVFINKAMESITGFSKEELCNGNIPAAGVVAEEDRERIENCFIKVLKGEVPILRDLEYRHLNRKGEDHIILLTIHPAKEVSGKIVGIEGIGRDITARKILEAELEKSKNLALLGEFSGSVAHQIRNPLGNILMGIKFLEKSLGFHEPTETNSRAEKAGKDSERLNREGITRTFGDVTDGIDKLNRVVTELLGYTKTFTPRLSLQKIDTIINEVLHTLRNEIKKNNIITMRDFDPAIPLISVDAVLISQVFQNVIQNAIEAMPENGTLTVKLRTSLLRPGYVEISIKDTGHGLNASETGKIFHPLYTTKASGTGLGLSLSHRIMDAHNGSIWAGNNKGNGITIHILLSMKANLKQTHRGGNNDSAYPRR